MTKVNNAKKIFIGVIVLIFLIITIFLMTKKKESFEVVKGTIENATSGGDKKIVLTDNDGNFSSIPSSKGLVPQGAIIAWSGSDIPKDWAICDGKTYDRTNGSEATASTSNENKITTPDLRGKFILGYNPQENPDSKRVPNNLGGVGGEEQNTLSVDQIPPHTHGISQALVGVPNGWTKFGDGSNQLTTRDSTDSTGGNKDGTTNPHNNMPPYYVLIYIIKL